LILNTSARHHSTKIGVMQHTISHSPSHATLDFILNEGEEIFAQPDSLVAMSTSIEITARVSAQTQSKWLGGIRNLASGESLFTAVFRAKRDEAFLSLAPRYLGDIIHLKTSSDLGYFLTQGSYLASCGGLTIAFKYAGVQGMLAKKGLFLMQTSGEGDVFCASYGAIIRKQLAEGEKFVVDNRFVIAFSSTVNFQLVKASKDVVGSYFSGGGLVNRYTGPGEVIYQTRGKATGGFFTRLFDLVT
jgi:uncharacterized protein (TIGR00266 family)